MENYWWVNHNQTHHAEINGGYIWSPEQERNGARSQFYVNLTLARPGDIVFSYANSKIMAIGVVAQSYKNERQPPEFGLIPNNWSNMGWLLPIEWRLLGQPISPKDNITLIKNLLPTTHSPINNLGNGNQKCYLAKISKELAEVIFKLAEENNPDIKLELIDSKAVGLEEKIYNEIQTSEYEHTEKEQLIKARIGQGLFRLNLTAIEKKCRVTGITEPAFLVASHIKPWRISNNYERLDGNNGLLLSPHIDRLFDRGWITITSNGEILPATSKVFDVLNSWGINYKKNIGEFSKEQKKYLLFHNEHVFIKNL